MKVTIDGRQMDVPAVWWEEGRVAAIDQTQLPGRVRIVKFSDHRQVARAIRRMVVRGAPTIGAAAAYGLALASRKDENLSRAAKMLKGTRPTAHDLFFAVDWMLSRTGDPVEAATDYAEGIVSECRKIGEHGLELIGNGARILTHCNAGALATVDFGTALAPMRLAKRAGREFFVFVDETRPRLQGARLTSWELDGEGIEHAIIVDSAAGHFMRSEVDLVIVGADRIAANGDMANKIGTYEKAVLARENRVPFYVAAPLSTFDGSIAGEGEIPIEMRDPSEVLKIGRRRIAPLGAKALNPAFDVTPARYITGFITARGVLDPSRLRTLFET